MAELAVDRGDIGGAGEKGLKGNALGFVSNVVIGVASTAPGYSLAVTLGLVAAFVGLQSPAIMILAFIPMLFIAAAYYYLNRADPDCGTTFSWVTKAMGPWVGWLGGWAIIVADIIVMASLAEIAAIYSFALFDIDPATTFGIAEGATNWPVVILGCIWIAVMTAICYVGIEASARTQVFLLGAEIATLAIFAVVALVNVYSGTWEDSVLPSLEWLNPFAIPDLSALAGGVLLAIFIYWGWDSTVSVNEESKDPSEGPGKAAIVATLILVFTYVIVTIAAQAVHGVEFLVADENVGDVLGALGADVLGSPLDKLLIIAVLTSAAASTQTTILPTARTAISMAAKRAAPAYFGRVHPRFLTPSTATIWMGVLSIAWYVGLTFVSTNILLDATLSLGLMIAFYYGLTGFACAIFYRHQLLKSAKNLLMIGILPVTGGLILTWAFVQSTLDYLDPSNSESGELWFGVGPPIVIVGAFAVLGLVLMGLQRIREPEFFRRRAEVVDPHVAIHGAPPAASTGGE